MHKTFVTARADQEGTMPSAINFHRARICFRLFTENNMKTKSRGSFSSIFSHAPSKWERSTSMTFNTFFELQKSCEKPTRWSECKLLSKSIQSKFYHLMTIFIIHTQFRSVSLAFAVNDRPSKAQFYFCFRWHFLMDSRICNLLRFFSKWTKMIRNAIELWPICPVSDERANERQWWNNN